jgi:NitT/TauT family transport system permease protein
MTAKPGPAQEPARRNPVIFGASMLALLAAWMALAALRGDPSTLPGPQAVASILWTEATTGRLWLHLGATLARVAAGFVIAMTLGSALGLALGRSARLNEFAEPWVVVMLNLPALVVIVLCYLWIGLTEAAAVTAVALNKTPMVLVSLREGVRAMDPAVDEMARVFRMGWWARMRHVVAPQLAPWFAASARNGLAVIWKIVLVIEFLGRSNGVGFQIHLYFQLFDIGHVLAYALSFVAVMLVIDFGLIQPWERRAAAWRRTASAG